MPRRLSGRPSSAETVTWPSGQYQAGIRWPHHSWRETFQSRMFVSQCSQVFSKCSGTIRVRPARVAASAFAASGSVRMNHWVLSRGSITSSRALAAPDDHLVGRLAGEVAARGEIGQDRGAAPRTGRVRRRRCPVVAIAAASSRIVGIARPWRSPVAWSSWSWAGVIFTAPVPNAALHDGVGDDRHVALDERDPDPPTRRAPGSARRRDGPRRPCRPGSSRAGSSRP